MTIIQSISRAVARWWEDRATMAAFERLDERSRRELEALFRLRKDEAETEFDSKPRSSGGRPSAHIAANARSAHS